MPKVRALCSAGITRPRRSYDPVRLPSWPPPVATLRPLPSPMTGLPRLPEPPFSDVPRPLPRRIKRVLVSIASPLMQPSPNGRRVGIRIVTFEACSGFTRVTAHRIAQPPKATFVARLQPSQLPNQAARQLPDQSTTIRVEPSSTDDSRLRGALPLTDLPNRLPRWGRYWTKVQLLSNFGACEDHLRPISFAWREVIRLGLREALCHYVVAYHTWAACSGPTAKKFRRKHNLNQWIEAQPFPVRQQPSKVRRRA